MRRIHERRRRCTSGLRPGERIIVEGQQKVSNGILPQMRKNEFPDFKVRQGIVVAVAPGNTAEEMVEQVTQPLEKYIFTYKEVKKVEDVLKVCLTTEEYFWQVAMLKEKQRTLDVVESQLAEMLKEVDAAVSAGIVNRNDLLQVQLKRNDTRSSRLNVENTLDVSRRLLAQYIGHDTPEIDVDFHITDSLPPSPDILYNNPEASLTLTPEYQLLQTKLQASRIEKNNSGPESAYHSHGRWIPL